MIPQCFEANYEPEWILLIAGSDPAMRQSQVKELEPHMNEIRLRSIIVAEVSPTEAVGLYGACRCIVSAHTVAKAYHISFERFTLSIVERSGCVKWVGPAFTSFPALMSVIDELPLHEAENATRGPSR